ncbi:type II toxin-antitoxin system prevent-host-death family antitoxin [Gluconacetobacter sp. Hr-1-5]|uniref:type II toxin-antitoxin system prevent-host-death family antitoxin n=1 Tax=Gluconacetobacter sp. Hr-1-5 TaxID=3395370 RepID=UPI003B5235EE
MKQFAAGDLTRNTGDLFEAAAIAPVAITKHRKPRFIVMSMEQYANLTRPPAGSQMALDVGDMPEDIGALCDEGIADYLNGR